MPVARAKLPTAAQAPQRITSWSYSRLRDWKKCGRYAFFKHVKRMKEPGNRAMERGGAIHTMAEVYVQAPKTPRKIPSELETFAVEFKDLRKFKAQCESEWAFTETWAPTGWFDEDCWLRVKMDVHYLDAKTNILHVRDHKTGKVADSMSFVAQEELYALAGLLQYPDCEGVNVMMWYLDAGVIGSTGHGQEAKRVETPDERAAREAKGALYLRSEEAGLKKKWAKEVKPMMTDTKFKENPTANCRYCHFSKAKAGPCKY